MDPGVATRELEQVVRAHLEPEIRALVAKLVPELVAQELETLAHRDISLNDSRDISLAGPSMKVCNVCGIEKPLGEFDAHRRTCKACRREAAARKRVVTTADGDDGPRRAAIEPD